MLCQNFFRPGGRGAGSLSCRPASSIRALQDDSVPDWGQHAATLSPWCQDRSGTLSLLWLGDSVLWPCCIIRQDYRCGSQMAFLSSNQQRQSILFIEVCLKYVSLVCFILDFIFSYSKNVARFVCRHIPCVHAKLLTLILSMFVAGEADTRQFDVYANTGFCCITAGAYCCQWVSRLLIQHAHNIISCMLMRF